MIVLAIGTLIPGSLHSWGFFAHEEINTLAIFLLPEPLFAFYKTHFNEMAELAVKADMRRYVVESEGARHYIDIDRYEDRLPLDTVNQAYDSAVEHYGAEFLQEHGMAPWNIFRLKYALTKAFEEGNGSDILRLSADLGHYIGDIHVPLHTHSNYNGQLSGQRGIHALWESRLPERYHEQYDLLTGQASYWENVPDTIWSIITESHELVQVVLDEELKTRNSLDDSKRYTYELRNGRSFRNYSRPYLGRYEKRVGQMVEQRMKNSIHAVASLWFTAWVDAGQPVLRTHPLQAKDTIRSHQWNVDSLVKDLGKRILGRSEPH